MSGFQLRSSADELRKRAQILTNIEIEDIDIAEALERLVASLNDEAELSEEGALGIEERIQTILCNRLRLERDWRDSPEIEQQQIDRPVILTGAGRSGSTKLHKLLAATGDFKYLQFWQQYNPALFKGELNENPQPRIDEAKHFINWFDARVPDAKKIHGYGVFEPEEETFLFDHARFLINFNITHTSIPSYTQWVMQQDMHAQLEYLKRWLKYLQWQFFQQDPRPWVLKNPLYAGLEPLLAQVFPEATMVATHRDPVARVASSAALVTHFKKAYSDRDRRDEAGPGMLAMMGQMAAQYVAGRDTHPQVAILDIAYPELRDTSEKVLEKIYAARGLTLSASARGAAATWEAENAQHKFGSFKYSLSHFDLTEEMVQTQFKEYIDRFAAYL